MARQLTLTCDFCGKPMERSSAKLHLTPVLPKGRIHAPMSGYTHQGDICESCTSKMERRLTPRTKRAKKETV